MMLSSLSNRFVGQAAMAGFSRPMALVWLLVLLPGLVQVAAAGGAGYYPDGQLQWEYLYQNGEVREAKWYDEAGRLTARAAFADGRQLLSEGYRRDGSLEWQSREQGEGRQEVTRFDTDRHVLLRYEIAAGQADGPSTLYYPDGKPRQSVTFRNGIPHGPARTYYQNGRLESEYAYREGQLHGVCRHFSPEGALTAEYAYVNGRLDERGNSK